MPLLSTARARQPGRRELHSGSAGVGGAVQSPVRPDLTGGVRSATRRRAKSVIHVRSRGCACAGARLLPREAGS